MVVFIVEIVPVKESKDTYILGAYQDYETAIKYAELEVNRKDACWWTNYRIAKRELI